jgi:hypothetical protein
MTSGVLHSPAQPRWRTKAAPPRSLHPKPGRRVTSRTTPGAPWRPWPSARTSSSRASRRGRSRPRRRGTSCSPALSATLSFVEERGSWLSVGRDGKRGAPRRRRTSDQLAQELRRKRESRTAQGLAKPIESLSSGRSLATTATLRPWACNSSAIDRPITAISRRQFHCSPRRHGRLQRG